MATKIHYLDGFRGYAACIVVIDHWLMMGRDDYTTNVTSVLWEPWFLRSPLRLFIDGGFAVAIFFVLSSYVLLAKVFKLKNRTDLIYSGMVRRYIRLMVPSFTALLLYFSWLHFGPFDGYSGCHAVGEMQNNKITDDISGNGNYTVSIVMGDVIENGLIGQWTYEPAIYTIEWTLQIELIGSLIVYLLTLAFISSPSVNAQRHWMYGFFFLLIPVLWWVGQYDTCPLPLQYMFTFLLGMLIADVDSGGFFAHIRTKWREDNETRFKALQATLFVFALYCGTCPYQQTMGRISDSFWAPLSTWLAPWLWLSIAAMLLMCSLLTWKEFQNVLSSQLGQTLGKLSFSIYLLHYQVLIVVDCLIMPYLGPVMSPAAGQQHDRTGAAFFCLVFIIAPFVWLVSVPFHTYCDDMSVVLSNEFKDWWSATAPYYCSCLTAKTASTSSPSLTTACTATASSTDIENPLQLNALHVAPSHYADGGVTCSSSSSSDPQSTAATSAAATATQHTGTTSNKNELKTKKIVLLCAVILFIIVGSIPAKQYDNCYSSRAEGGIVS